MAKLEHPELVPRTPDGQIDYQAYLQTSEYDFLRTNPHLGKHICLLDLGGSRAAGVDQYDSDVDIRGVAVNTLDEIIGITPDFYVVDHSTTDTVIYSLCHAVNMFTKCNPTALEMLGLEPDQYLYVNDIGQDILDNKHAFLSRQAIDAFGGYATRQYDQLEHNLLNNGGNDDKELQMLRRSIEHAIASLNAMSPKHVIDMKVSVLPNTDNDMSNVVISGKFDKVPVTNLKAMISNINSIQKDYGKINKRNSKKDEFHLNKHMSTLIKMYFMGIDLHEKGEIITYRPNERDLLLAIRRGEYTVDDGMHVRDEFFDMLHDVQDKYLYAVKHTVLPETYDVEAIREMMRRITTKNLLEYEDKR